MIILDHLQFWPSIWQYTTGQGRLWVSAAEGFFIISGLLIGYLRAYKGANHSLKDISKKLWKRAALLWFWCVIITTTVLLLSLYLPGNNSLLPQLPSAQLLASPMHLSWEIVTMNYSSDWIYFLRLYAIMLAVTPVFLWLIRKGQALLSLAIILGIYLLSLLLGLNEASLQWQVLFFGAALIGWKLESILSWFSKRPATKNYFLYGLSIVTVATMLLSYFMVHGWSYVESPTTALSVDTYVSIRSHVDPLFSNNPLVPIRIALSFVWFFGLLSIFHLLKKPIKRFLGWLLITLGTASLTAYCLHAVVLVFIVKFVQLDGGFLTNTIAGLAIVIVIWGLMKLPFIRKILPQ